MKVYIGPHTSWIGPFQIADTLQKVGVSEDKCYEIGEWLDEKTPLTKICNWIESKKNRKVQVQIDDYDTWNCDDTLAIIILPLLKRFQELKHSSAWVDLDDVPENLRPPEDYVKEYDWEWDEFNDERWNWILSELIWTFDQLQFDNDWEMVYHKTDPYDKEGFNKHQERISNGLRLFGKYYQNLWD
jgi:hypothetical protein